MNLHIQISYMYISFTLSKLFIFGITSKKSGGTFPCSTLFSFKSFFLVFDVLYICKIDNMIYYSIKMNGILCQGNCISLFTLPFFIGLIHQKNC